MKKSTLKKLFCCLLAWALLAPFAAAARAEDPVEKVTLIVQMEDGSTLEQMREAAKAGISEADRDEQYYTNRVLNAQRRVRSKILLTVDAGVEFGYTYTAAMNGFSMDADPADIESIKALDGVKNVFISHNHTVTDPVNTPDSAVQTEPGGVETNISKLHEEGWTGAGTVIAIIDTEFDTNHEFLSGDVKNPKLQKSDVANVINNLGLNAEASANRVWRSEKIPFAYNYDIVDGDTYPTGDTKIHGTHVAGIAAGRNGKYTDGSLFDGAAPEAQILCMAVPYLGDYHCIAAMDDAIKLGADVLNLSWGGDYTESGFYDEIFANMLEAGIFIANSAGNAHYGYTDNLPTARDIDYGAIGSPADSGLACTVASADNKYDTYMKLQVFVDGVELTTVREENYFAPFQDTVDENEGLEYVLCGTDYDYEGDLTGKIAVFDVGEDYDEMKMMGTARSRNASAVILVLPEEKYDAWFNISYEALEDTPAVTMCETEREILTAGTHVTSIYGMAKVQVHDEISLSYFSSWGVFSSLKLDPIITAIGGNVYSSFPNDDYGTFSGTSMSSPQIAGAAAVLREYLTANEPSFTELTPSEQVAEIENRMMSTARTLHTYDGDGERVICSPRAQGAGLLDAYAAAKTPVVLTGEGGRGKVELFDGLGDTVSFTFTAKNLTGTEAAYTDVSMAVITSGLSEDGHVMDYSQVLKTVSRSIPETVTVPAYGSVEIPVSFTLDPDQVGELEKDFIYGFFVEGYVYLTDSTGASPDLVIPFMGFKGDWSGGAGLDVEYNLTNGLKLGSGIDCYHEYSTNYSGRYYDACRPLGQNSILYYHEYLFWNTIDDFSVYSGRQFAGISPNGDNAFDFLCVSFVPLRKAEKVIVELKDEDGNVMYSYLSDWVMQRYSVEAIAFYYEDLKDNGLTKEGNYTAVINLYRNNGETVDVAELPFYVDNTAPTVNSYSVRNGFLRMSITDNTHVMGIELTDADTGDFLTCYPVAGSSEASISLDISEYANRLIKVSVFDYAQNHSEVYAKFTANYIKGDINGDGEISNADLVMLARYTVKLEVFDETKMAAADWNRDGVVDNKDVVELARRLVNA